MGYIPAPFKVRILNKDKHIIGVEKQFSFLNCFDQKWNASLNTLDMTCSTLKGEDDPISVTIRFHIPFNADFFYIKEIACKKLK